MKRSSVIIVILLITLSPQADVLSRWLSSSLVADASGRGRAGAAWPRGSAGSLPPARYVPSWRDPGPVAATVEGPQWKRLMQIFVHHSSISLASSGEAALTAVLLASRSANHRAIAIPKFAQILLSARATRCR